MSGTGGGKATPRSPGRRDQDGLDAPEPARFLSERSGSWRLAQASTHPDVAKMALEKNLGAFTPDSDTEETPPTAYPGQFRFEGLDDDDGPVPATYDDDADDDPVLAQAEAEISAARLALAPSTAAPAPEAAPAENPATSAPLPAATPTEPGPSSYGLMIGALLLVALAVVLVAQLL